MAAFGHYLRGGSLEQEGSVVVANAFHGGGYSSGTLF